MKAMGPRRANFPPYEDFSSLLSGELQVGRLRDGIPPIILASLPLVLKQLLLLMVVLTLASATAAQRSLRTDPLVHPIPRREAIVNGQTVAAAEEPWVAFQVGLFLRYPNGTSIGVFCGGSIIAPSYVLTAAHCFSVFGFNVSSGRTHWELNTDPKSDRGVFIVFAGAIDPTEPEFGRQERFVSELWIDRDYVHRAENGSGPHLLRYRLSDDLAVLKLVEPFSFSDRVRSIDLSPDDSDLKVNADLTFAGWGSILTRVGPLPQKLQMVTVNHLPNVCAKYLKSGGYKEVPDTLPNVSFYYDERSMICAGCREVGTGVCPGDSGGCPVQVGLASWQVAFQGVICGLSVLPDVYARVSRGLSWIESVVGQPVRSTVPVSPTENCENCLADDFPDGKNCEKTSRYDLNRCYIQAHLASSFTLKEPVCEDGKKHVLKAYINFSDGFKDWSKGLTKKVTDGHVVFLYTDEGVGNGVIKLPPVGGTNGEIINTPLRQPKVSARNVAFNPTEGAWVYRSSAAGCSSARTYAALYILNPGKGTTQYYQISLAVGNLP